MTPTIRTATAADMAYVFTSWTRDSYRMLEWECSTSKRGRAPAYGLYRPLFEALQRRVMAKAKVLVAANPDDDDQILGALVYEPGETPVIHWSGSKREFSGLPVNTLLYEFAGIAYDKPAIHSGGMPPRREREDGKETLHCRLPKPWIYVPFGLMP
jgi:hypothetical protein